MKFQCNTMRFVCYAIKKCNKGLDNMVSYAMLCYAMLWDLKTPPYADEFQTFQSKIIEVKVYH